MLRNFPPWSVYRLSSAVRKIHGHRSSVPCGRRFYRGGHDGGAALESADCWSTVNGVDAHTSVSTTAEGLYPGFNAVVSEQPYAYAKLIGGRRSLTSVRERENTSQHELRSAFGPILSSPASTFGVNCNVFASASPAMTDVGCIEAASGPLFSLGITRSPLVPVLATYNGHEWMVNADTDSHFRILLCGTAHGATMLRCWGSSMLDMETVMQGFDVAVAHCHERLASEPPAQSVPGDVDGSHPHDVYFDARAELEAFVASTKPREMDSWELLRREFIDRHARDFHTSVTNAAFESATADVLKEMVVDGQRLDGRAFHDRIVEGYKVGFLSSRHKGSCLVTKGSYQAMCTAVPTPLASNDWSPSFDLEGDWEVPQQFQVQWTHQQFSRRHVYDARGRFVRRSLASAMHDAMLQSTDIGFQFPFSVSAYVSSLSGTSLTASIGVAGTFLAIQSVGLDVPHTANAATVGVVSQQDVDDLVSDSDHVPQYTILSDPSPLERQHAVDATLTGSTYGGRVAAIHLDVGSHREVAYDAVKAAIRDVVRDSTSGEESVARALTPASHPSKTAPAFEYVPIPSDRRGNILGAGGFRLRQSLSALNASAVFKDDQTLCLYASDPQSLRSARAELFAHVGIADVNERVHVEVVALHEFGVDVVETKPNGRKGFIHLTELSPSDPHVHLDRPEDAVRIGDRFDALVMDADRTGLLKLSQRRT